MSIANQTAFLKEFEKLLLVKSQTYRRRKGKRVNHIFTASKTAMRRGIIDMLREELPAGEKQNAEIGAVLTAMDPFLGTFIDEVRAELKRKVEGDSVVEGSEVKYVSKQRVVYYISATQDDAGRMRNIYQQIYRTYDTKIFELGKKVAQITKDVTGSTVSKEAKAIWHLEHGNLEGISESQVSDALVQALATQTTEEELIGEAELKQFLQNSNIDLRVVRDSNTGKMLVFIGSKLGNYKEAKDSRRRRKELTDLVKELRKTVEETGEKIIGLPGSPSFLDLKRKEAIKKVVDPIKKRNPKAKVKITENLKEKGSKTDLQTKNKLVSTTLGKGLKSVSGRAPNRPSRRVQKGVSSSPLAMIKMINAKLPRVVAGNMGSPALENRTGRFAGSVRVVDAQVTPKGFTSFGYTYQRDPYGVFESTSGTRFASPERDPRVLIEGSIREIAQEMAIGRFFTRRV